MADSTTHIVQYVGNIQDVQSKIRELERLNTKAAESLGRDFSKSIDIVSNKLTGFKEVPIQINGQEAIKTIQNFDTVTKTADGGVRTFRDSITRVNGAITGVTTSFKEGGKVARTFGDDLTTLLKRAALTIPVWFAIRNGIASIFRTVRDGLHNLVEFDKILQKTKFNLEGVIDNPAKAIDELSDRITALSVSTGVSTEIITAAFERFASAGFDVETSFQGAVGAVQTSIALFGDAGQAADVFAAAFKVLVDESKDAVAPQQQIRDIFAQVAELAKTNVFTFDQFKESLEKFSATAKTMNLTTQQTIAILATLNSAAIKGSRGGTLLRTTFNKLIGNLDEVASVLGIQVNPQLDSAFDILLKVVSAVSELNKQSSLAPEATQALSQIFELRGTEVIRALVAIGDVLEKNIALTPDVNKFTKEIDELNNSLSGQVRIAQNLNKELGKAFVQGLIGGKDFIETLKTINSIQEVLINDAGAIGSALKISFHAATLIGIKDIKKDIEDLDSLRLTNIRRELLTALSSSGVDLSRLAPRQLLDILNNLDNFNIPEGFKDEFGKLVQETLDNANKLARENPIKVPIVGDTTNIRKGALSFAEQQEISKLIVKSQLESLRNQGASNSQLLKAETSLNRQFGIHEKVNDVLQRQLDTEIAINQEQRLRNSLSSESIKLFEIAQTEGVGIAKTIGEVLAGQRDFNTFVRLGGRELEIFKQNFGDVFEQQQAQAFFRGNNVPGLEGLRGGGNIPIEEQAIRGNIPQFFNTQAAIQNRQVQGLVPTVKAEINARLSVNVEGLDFTQAKQELKDELKADLDNPESDFSKQLDRHIDAH